ncbi:MAG: methyltransferase domain-containing protein [Bacteroidales bacterium]|nr:methyltransferase domain-containing protein [Bacteroidales bacterium]
MQILNAEYWDTIYQAEKTSWDIGYVSTPLKTYFDQLTDLSIRILVAGSGNAYEAEYLWELGFKNVFILDFSRAAIQSFLKRYPHFPKQNILHEDFFDHQSHYDLIVEQTFLTSLLPPQRKAYAQKMHQLLNPKGKLMGLVFNHLFPFEGPPFGGTEQEYRILFQPYFQFVVFEKAYNSIKPRKGRELFFILKKKETD